jgi:hypothetical protein
MKTPPPPKTPPPARAKKEGDAIPLRIRFEQKHDFWGDPMPWHFSRDALTRCLLGTMHRPDNAILQSYRMLARAGGEIRRIRMHHFQEGQFQIIMKTRVESAHSAREFCTVISKDAGHIGRVAAEEFRNLQELYARDSRHVVRPLAGGFLELRTEHGDRKRLFTYCTEWLEGYHELGLNKQMNFYINEVPFHHFNADITRHLKKNMLQICYDLYDPATGSAIEPPLIAAGDFVITRPAYRLPLKLKLIACRRILRGLTPQQCGRLYLDYEGEWGGKIFRFT